MSDQYPSPYDQSGQSGYQQGGPGQQPQPAYRATPATTVKHFLDGGVRETTRDRP